MKQLLWILVTWLVLIGPLVQGTDEKNPCRICELLVDSIYEEMVATQEKSPGGGNSKWEEGRLKPWDRSELRFVEISESICNPESKSKKKAIPADNNKKKKSPSKETLGKCQTLFGNHEEVIEKWFFSESRDETPLRQLICVQEARVCCEPGLYGKTCKSCPGLFEEPEEKSDLENKKDVDDKGVRVCSGHGECDGEGTRQGTGKCKCEAGWTGGSCNECADGYFSDPVARACVPCDEACQGKCTGRGPSECLECKSGYYLANESEGCAKCSNACKTCDKEGVECLECAIGFAKVKGMIFDSKECTDIDECKDKVCKETEDCVNNVGSYSCVAKPVEEGAPEEEPLEPVVEEKNEEL